MYHTLLTASERPPSSLEVKRALLTYERVIISDPGDRDYFPPQLFMSALSTGFGLPFPFGMNLGPVRPLGKVQSFDSEFDRMMDEIYYARREGLVDVVSTYDQAAGQGLTIGGVPDGGYPLNSAFMLWAYRNIAREQGALRSAINGDPFLPTESPEVIHGLAGGNAQADGAVNDDSALPLIEGDFLRVELREAYTRIARARIASVMKSIGYCTAKKLVPTFRDQQSKSVLGYLTRRASEVVDAIAEDDPHLTFRSRVLDLAHSEYINDRVLMKMTIDDVLRLRTKAWGKQAEQRDELLRSAAKLAQECKSAVDFDTEVKSRIRSYRNSWDEVALERRGMDFSINCDLVSGSIRAMGMGFAGELGGALAQIQSGIGAATVLLAGCLLTLNNIKEYRPVREKIKAIESEFGDHVCFGIHDFYRGF